MALNHSSCVKGRKPRDKVTPSHCQNIFQSELSSVWAAKGKSIFCMLSVSVQYFPVQNVVCFESDVASVFVIVFIFSVCTVCFQYKTFVCPLVS